jgi:hypothetical protein
MHSYSLFFLLLLTFFLPSLFTPATPPLHDRYSIASALVVSAALAVPGYMTFRNTTKSNVLNNYAASDPVFIAVRIAYVVTMAFTYPIR